MSESQAVRSRSTTMTGAGDYVSMSRSWVRDAIARGDLPFVRLGCSVRVLFTDLDRLLESRRIERKRPPAA